MKCKNFLNVWGQGQLWPAFHHESTIGKSNEDHPEEEVEEEGVDVHVGHHLPHHLQQLAPEQPLVVVLLLPRRNIDPKICLSCNNIQHIFVSALSIERKIEIPCLIL